MKKKIIIVISSLVIIASCQSNQKTEINKPLAIDSSAKQAQSAMDKMVDEMNPPDSTYSGDFFLRYDHGLMKVKGFFRFGKRHGKWFYFYPNGYVWSEALFTNGKMDGVSKAYHNNGKVYYEGNYKLDTPTGIWNFYDTSGVLQYIRTYDSLGKVLSDKPITPQVKK